MEPSVAFDTYFELKEEPVRSCLQALRAYIVAYDNAITEAWKYGMPFFCIKGKMFCYVWVDRKTAKPYLGIVEGRKIEHAALVMEKRNRMKIMWLDTEQELPLQQLDEVMDMAMALYK